MVQIYSRVEYKKFKLGRREQLIMLEIGRDLIDTASSFVDYMRENYGFSKSSTWYCLNRLKVNSLIGFANKAEQGKPLCLTRSGLGELSRLEGKKNDILTYFSDMFLSGNKITRKAGRHEETYENGITLYSRTSG